MEDDALSRYITELGIQPGEEVKLTRPLTNDQVTKLLGEIAQHSRLPSLETSQIVHGSIALLS